VAHKAQGFGVTSVANDIPPDRGSNPEVESLNSKAGALHGVVDCEARTHLWSTRLRGGGHRMVLRGFEGSLQCVALVDGQMCHVGWLALRIVHERDGERQREREIGKETRDIEGER
jgi:hypothetical protein